MPYHSVVRVKLFKITKSLSGMLDQMVILMHINLCTDYSHFLRVVGLAYSIINIAVVVWIQMRNNRACLAFLHTFAESEESKLTTKTIPIVISNKLILSAYLTSGHQHYVEIVCAEVDTRGSWDGVPRGPCCAECLHCKPPVGGGNSIHGRICKIVVGQAAKGHAEKSRTYVCF